VDSDHYQTGSGAHQCCQTSELLVLGLGLVALVLGLGGSVLANKQFTPKKSLELFVNVRVFCVSVTCGMKFMFHGLHA